MSAQFVCSFPVMLRRFDEGSGTRDARGRPAGAHGEPEKILVFAWYVGATEPGTDGHQNRSVFDGTFYPQSKDNVSERDLVELPGYGWFEVDGRPTNYDHNPFWAPGLVDGKLRKVDG